MASEIWTAKEEIACERDGKPMIVFEVKDEATGEVRTDRKYKDALPLMFMLGGYSAQIGILLELQPLPWRFRKIGEHIYLDGPSIGDPTYHPIDPVLEPA